MFVRDGFKTKVDLTSQAVGSSHFLQPWYPDGLTERILGPLAKDPVRLSRHYFDVGLVIDFEPDPHDERFYSEEKRIWCHEQQLAYVPIYLRDTLTIDQLADRIREARELLLSGRLETETRTMLDAAEPDVALLRDPAVALFVDQETLRRVQDGIASGKNWKGKARSHMLVRFKREIIAEILMRYPSGAVGDEFRADSASHVTGG